jgi:hypothetical protein
MLRCGKIKKSTQALSTGHTPRLTRAAGSDALLGMRVARTADPSMGIRKAAEQAGIRYNDALIYHLRALFLMHVEGMNSNNVDADLKTAIQIAQAQTAKGLELPAAVSLARLWRDQARCGKRANCWLRFTGGLLRGLTRAI